MLLSCAILTGQEITSKEAAMNLTSGVFTNGDTIPGKYTCDGQNISPSLYWNDIPDDTKKSCPYL